MRMDDVKLVKKRGHTLNVPSMDITLPLHKRWRLARVPNTIIREPPSVMSSIRIKLSPVFSVHHSSPNLMLRAAAGVCGLRYRRCQYNCERTPWNSLRCFAMSPGAAPKSVGSIFHLSCS